MILVLLSYFKILHISCNFLCAILIYNKTNTSERERIFCFKYKAYLIKHFEMTKFSKINLLKEKKCRKVIQKGMCFKGMRIFVREFWTLVRIVSDHKRSTWSISQFF